MAVGMGSSRKTAARGLTHDQPAINSSRRAFSESFTLLPQPVVSPRRLSFSSEYLRVERGNSPTLDSSPVRPYSRILCRAAGMQFHPTRHATS
jgi:hypothetical protein